jgi:hypothetical protein
MSAGSGGTVDDLVALNTRVGEMEQQGAGAVQFFTDLLSDGLVFRRASGKVVGKGGPDGFIEGLKNNPFKSRLAEDIAVHPVGNRVLVTLVVVGTRNDDGSIHRYRNIRLFSHQGSRWVLECWYNYEITGL